VILVHVVVETSACSFAEYSVHANNRSRHALSGAIRNAFRKYPNARSVEAEFADERDSRLTLTRANTLRAQEA
jgi:hypothetical protein